MLVALISKVTETRQNGSNPTTFPLCFKLSETKMCFKLSETHNAFQNI